LEGKEIKSGFISEKVAVNPEQLVHTKNGEQLPQSPSFVSCCSDCTILSSGQLSNEQQGTAKRKSKYADSMKAITFKVFI
jgi:hypothetical protein